jgi:p24 family protein gamma-3
MIMKAPNGHVLYQDQRKQYDSFRTTAVEEGQYEVCFSNEFSTFTHKLVFIDWQVGDEAPLGVGPSSPLGAMTLMETSLQQMHDRMSGVGDYQKHYQIRESQGRQHAEDLNERVQMWSIIQLVVVIIVGVLQVTLIRSFFSNRR